MLKKSEIGFLILSLCFIVAISGCISSTVKVAVNYPGSWNGTITDSSGTQSIQGTGNKTIDLGSITGSLRVKVEKKDKGSDTLMVSVIRGDKTVNTMNSSTKYGELDDVTLSIYLTS